MSQQDEIRRQREKVDKLVVHLWNELNRLGPANMRKVDIDLWWGVTQHPAIGRKLSHALRFAKVRGWKSTAKRGDCNDEDGD